MNTQMRFEAMQKALPFAAELLDCEALKEYKKKMRDADTKLTTGNMMQDLMHIFLIEKQDAVFGLLGAVCDKTAEEIAAQEWEETKKLMENPILNDVCDFFIFSVRMVRNV